MTVTADFTAVGDQTELRRVFGHFPSGLVVVAALGPDGPAGLLVSSFTSVSLEPPLVSVNIAHSSTTLPILRGTEHWGVTVLASGQRGLTERFRRPAAQRFDGVDWAATDDGAVHLDGGAAAFHTRVSELVPAGDHVIALLEVSGHVATTSVEPLVFHHSRLRDLEQENRA